MEINPKEIPSLTKHVDYIDYWRNIYKMLYDQKMLQILNPAVVEIHFARNFDKLRHIMDEDLFEWNHAMIVTVVMAQMYDRMPYADIPEEFCVRNCLFQVNEKTTFASALLNLTIIQFRWQEFDLRELPVIKKYCFNVHKCITQKFIYADNLKTMNRWNMMKKVGKNFFQPNCTALMLVTCRIAMQLNELLAAKAIQPYVTTALQYKFNDATMTNFFNWAKGEKTYFSIRNFRNRILNLFWRFMNDEATRCLYTYKRTGEIPSIHSHVTGKYPQQWTSSVQHFILYGEPHKLISHDNKKIKDATLLALWEAHMKTIYGFKFTQFCVCIDHDIIDQAKHILSCEHPLVLYSWHKWYLAFKGKIYKYNDLQETLLAWLHHLHEDCDSMMLNQISLLKICRKLCITEIEIEKDFDLEDYIEVSI